MITIINTDSVVSNFPDYEKFIAYVQGVYIENESLTERKNKPVWPEQIAQCKFYLAHYCNDLMLIES